MEKLFKLKVTTKNGNSIKNKQVINCVFCRKDNGNEILVKLIIISSKGKKSADFTIKKDECVKEKIYFNIFYIIHKYCEDENISPDFINMATFEPKILSNRGTTSIIASIRNNNPEVTEIGKEAYFNYVNNLDLVDIDKTIMYKLAKSIKFFPTTSVRFVDLRRPSSKTRYKASISIYEKLLDEV